MKLTKLCFALTVKLLLITSAHAQMTSEDAFRTLTLLEDTWGKWEFIENQQRGSCTKGKNAISPIQFKLIGKGTAVQEDLMPGSAYHMVTLYHLEDLNENDLIGTHYCVKKNQPSFKADLQNSTPNKLIFKCDENRSRLCKAEGLGPHSYVDSVTYELTEDDGDEILTIHYMGRGQQLNDPNYTRCKFIR